MFHNYKFFFSILLLRLVDADYKFLWVDVGANGSTSDCAVLNQSDLKEALETDGLGFPPLEDLQLGPKATSGLVLACVCLHNLMRIRYP